MRKITVRWSDWDQNTSAWGKPVLEIHEDVYDAQTWDVEKSTGILYIIDAVGVTHIWASGRWCRIEINPSVGDVA